MKKLQIIIAALALLIIPTSFLSAAPDSEKAPQEDGQLVTISVDGLSCPFCVYGLEKKLKKVSGVKTVKIELKKGLALVRLKAGQPIDPAKTTMTFTEAVKKAGFTARKITISADSKKSPQASAEQVAKTKEQKQ